MSWAKSRMFAKFLSVLLSLSILFVGTPWRIAPTSAYARGKKKVFILGFEKFSKAVPKKKKQKEVVSAIDAQLRMFFEDNKRVSVIEEDELKKKLKPKPVEGADIEPSTGTKGSKKDIKKARRYIDDGLDAIDEEEYDDAIENFAKAEKYIKKAPNKINAKMYKRMVKMYLGWAIAAYENGDKDEARTALKKLLAIAPDYELDEDEDYPSRLIKDFKKYQRRGGKATLKITAYPTKKAVIKVNGEERDSNPLTMEGIFPGLYIVEISAPGYETYTEAVEVEDDGTELEVRLPGGEEEKPKDLRKNYKRVVKALPKGKLDDDFVDDLKEITRAAGIDYVVFGLFYKVDRKRVGFTGFMFSKDEGYMVHTKPFAVRKIDDAVDETERVTKQFGKFLKRFPKKGSKYYYEPGQFEVPEFEEEEEEEDEEPVAVSRHKKRDMEEEEEPAAEEEEAPVPEVAEEEEEEPEVEKIDLDTDVSFLLDDSDSKKREEDMSAEGEASFGVQKEPPIYARWWFWTIIGVALVGGGVTAGVLLAPRGPDNTPTVTLYKISK